MLQAGPGKTSTGEAGSELSRTRTASLALAASRHSPDAQNVDLRHAGSVLFTRPAPWPAPLRRNWR